METLTCIHRSHHACGGLAERNRLLMQLTADATGRDVLVARVLHASAVGAAVHAAAAAGTRAGGYPTLAEALAHMGSRIRERHTPRPDTRSVYDELYEAYRQSTTFFSGDVPGTMKRLRRLRRRATS